MKTITALLALATLVACQPTKAPQPPSNETPTPSTAALAAAPDAGAALAQPPKPAAVGSLTVQVVPRFERITNDTRTLDVMVRLTGTGDVPAGRPPIDLALVIDRSGSMSGDKIRSAKTAALQLLDKLDAQDRVTLISYSDRVQTHVTRLPMDATGKQAARDALLALSSNGMTALGPAMFAALDATEQGLGDETRLAHVMLMSDGLANVGEKRPEVLGARAAQSFAKGVSVSTVGVGLDYNEDLMTRLADMGGGRYHFVKDAEAIAGVLDDEMKGLVATVARGVELEFKGGLGVGVAKVFGYSSTTDDAITRARIGALGAGQSREVLVRLTLPAYEGKVADLGMLAVHFKDVPADGVARRVDLPVKVELTADAAAMQASEQAEVTVRVAELEAAEKVEIAARAADTGDFEGATGALQIAIDDLKDRSAKRPSPKLARKIKELEEAQSEVASARGSEAGRKAYTKKYKAKAYSDRKK